MSTTWSAEFSIEVVKVPTGKLSCIASPTHQQQAHTYNYNNWGYTSKGYTATRVSKYCFLFNNTQSLAISWNVIYMLLDFDLVVLVTSGH